MDSIGYSPLSNPISNMKWVGQIHMYKYLEMNNV